MIKKLWTIFWYAPGARPVLVAFSMWLASVSDMLGMGALVPLASQLSSDQGTSSSYLGRAIVALYSGIGISPTFTNLLILLGIALVLKSTIAFLSMRFVAISVANVGTEIRKRLLKSTLNARWAYYVDHQPGEVAGMISAQSQLAGDAYLAVSDLVVTLILGIGLLTTAFLVSGPLVIFCQFAVSALAFPLYFILRRAQLASLKQFSTSTNLISGVQDVMSNIDLTGFF
ncbi:MAG: hypothetical protein ABIN69_18450 [Aestuariivirga sp.]